MISWFDVRMVKKFGLDAAYFCIDQIPGQEHGTQKQFANKCKTVLDKLNHKIVNFKRDNALNIYKIATLANTFKWALRDAGFEEAYADNLTNWLIARLK
jgi:hypothetical protein